MKFARISLAVLMLMAIILRSLPDSIFNYLHEHTHISSNDTNSNSNESISDYKHNCHIEDWNFESFEVVETNFQTFQYSSKQILFNTHHELVLSISISQNCRAPPVA